MKTKFEELWSEIHYTSKYDKSKIKFWYLNDGSLEPILINEILKKEDGMLQIMKNPEDTYPTEIPIYRIYVVSYDMEVIMDRREGNYQVENLQIDLKY